MNSKQFAKLYDDHYGLLYYWVLGRVRNKAKADDLTAQAFTSAWEYRAQLRDLPKAKSWLYQITSNLICKDHRHESLIDWENVETHNPADPRDFTEELAKWHEVERIAAAALMLDRIYRSAFECYVRGIPVNESARMLRVPRGTYATRLHHAKKKVRILCESTTA